ncbi:MAG: hypothetical protein K0R09_1626 [Clostridiales bacterium]|jgi:hypothetical protein|nr:hypothetical protein [Clostridiales bacterium]
MEKNYLYIVLTRTNTMISRLIQFFKNDEYTHAAISLDKGLDNMYSFSRKHTYNPFIGRFKKEDVNEGLYKFCDTLPGLIIEIEVSRDQHDKAKDILEHFISNSSFYKYNYKGLLCSLLNKPSSSTNRFLCSEFVYHILKECGIIDFNIAGNLVRPQSLLNIEGRIIYEGNLRETKQVKTSRLNILYE